MLDSLLPLTVRQDALIETSLGDGVQNYQSAQLARSMFKQYMDKSTNEIISSCDKRQKRFNHFIQLVECMRSQPTID
jgi:hypothetical protein